MYIITVMDNQKNIIYLGLITLLILSGCADPADFSQYESLNLIADQDFSYTGNDDGEQLWLREYIKHQVDEPSINPDSHMIFEPVDAAEAGSITGLPAGAAMYRLEIPNLIPNGDFETDPTASGWSETGTFSLITWDPPAVPSHIEGRVLDFYHPTGGWIKLNTPAYLTSNVKYSLRFDLRLKGTELDNMLFEYNYNDGSTPPIDWSPVLIPYSQTDIINFPVEKDKNISAFTATAAGFFTIGWSVSNKSKEGYMDNFRITRIDRSNTLYLDVPFRMGERPELLSGGTYTFSVYVKKENSTRVTPDYPNRYHAEGLTMGINDTSGGLSGNKVDISGITDSTWIQVSVQYSNSQRVQINTPVNTGDSVMTLTMVPTDWNSTTANTAGSILISSPSLTWSPDALSE